MPAVEETHPRLGPLTGLRFYNSPTKNLDVLTVRGCFWKFWGGFGGCCWRIVGQVFATCLGHLFVAFDRCLNSLGKDVQMLTHEKHVKTTSIRMLTANEQNRFSYAHIENRSCFFSR